MALAAAGRDDAARRMLDGDARIRGRRGDGAADRPRRRAAGLRSGAGASAAAIIARAVDLMRPVLGDMHQLGGSHAQQDVLMQLFLDSAVKADCADDVRLILDQARERRFRC